MFNKFIGSAFLSANAKAARRNSSAMLDALEAIATVAPRKVYVSRVVLDTLRKLEHQADATKALGPFRGQNLLELLEKEDDDASDTSPWLLVFNVHRYFSEKITYQSQMFIWEGASPPPNQPVTQHIEYPEGKTDFYISFAREGTFGKSVTRFDFEKVLVEEERKRESWRGKSETIMRSLYGRFDPSLAYEHSARWEDGRIQADRTVARYFGAELYRNMFRALTTMEESLDYSCSDEELAKTINQKNKNPRFLSGRCTPFVEPISSISSW